VKWAQIPITVLDQPANKALALDVARKSMVLLKNQGNVLPLKKDIGTIAVIGPNADQKEMLLGNYNGLPSDPVTPLRGIREAVSKSTRVIYARGSELADSFPVLEVMPSTVLTTPESGPGLRAEYYGSKAMDGAPLISRDEPTLDVNWREGAPRPDMKPDDFAVKWSGAFHPPTTGMYRLGLVGTMKFQLFLDDSLVARSTYAQRDDEFPDPRMVQSTSMRLEAGRSYRVRVEARETYGDAQLRLVWSAPSDNLQSDAVKAAQQADAVVMFLGLTARLEGEEMPVRIEGFRGGDRTTLDLPGAQERLLESIVAVGKPTVLVLMNGSALAVNWAQEHVPAIVEAWYPGQAAGTAIADVLFGDYNPGGRLPVTFYKSVNDIPPFESYDMKGRTYRFFDGTPLYPFGHGLSYTTFTYKNLRTSAERVPAIGTVTVKVDVTNSGARAGDEVVQLYAQHMGSKVARAKKELRGFRRVTLRPGETKTVQLTLPVSSLAYWDTASHGWLVESEPVKLQVGASSSDVRIEKTIRTIAGRVTR
jgi:beta-glucosidase